MIVVMTAVTTAVTVVMTAKTTGVTGATTAATAGPAQAAAAIALSRDALSLDGVVQLGASASFHDRVGHPHEAAPASAELRRRYASAPFDAGGSPTLQVPTTHQLSQQVDP